jgi:Tfp pilus assembly protein PilX
MNRYPSLHVQRGATLVVGLVMLALITLLVTTAFTLSNTNLKSVGNMQFRNEAIAAVNKAIEQIVGSPFTVSPLAEMISVDINNDETPDYTVAVAIPTCIRATPAGSTTLSSLSLGQSMSQVTDWNTVWEINASVADPASGASVRAVSGVRVVRSDSQKKVECP